MLIHVLKPFLRRGKMVSPGEVFWVDDAIFPKLAELVEELTFSCPAKKVGGRICGSTKYRIGVNGHVSCADMHCQIPTSSWHKYDHLRRHLP